MTTKLSLTARYLLTYIRFKTNNNRPFFAGNDTIAKVIGCTESSTKVIINTLIREGYKGLGEFGCLFFENDILGSFSELVYVKVFVFQCFE